MDHGAGNPRKNLQWTGEIELGEFGKQQETDVQRGGHDDVLST
jgi:hypothetical protein